MSPHFRISALIVASIFLASPAKTEEPITSEHISEHQERLFNRMHVCEAWETTKGSPDVVIGVIDNGFDFFHPDLKGQVLPGYYYSGGYHSEFYENVSHGTLVSSIMVAKDDGSGMIGLAPTCRVLAASQGMIEHALVKLRREFYEGNPEAQESDFQQEIVKHSAEVQQFGARWVNYQVEGAAEAIHYLVDQGVKVINISGFLSRALCPDKDSWKKLEDAFQHAADKNVVIVTSAGNHATEVEDYPGSSANVLVVGATLSDDSRWETEIELRGSRIKQGSCFGRRLSVMAPVEGLAVCVPHDDSIYRRKDSPMGPTNVPFSGIHKIAPNGATSSAAPIVFALVALVRSVRPDLDAKTVVNLVQDGSTTSVTKGYDELTGHGRVDFAETIRLALAFEEG